MGDSVTPAASEYEDEDFDVVNAERIEGVEDDDDTADEDPQDVAYEEDEEVRFRSMRDQLPAFKCIYVRMQIWT
jgi:hypothetical protein